MDSVNFSNNELAEYVNSQVSFFFPDKRNEIDLIKLNIPEAIHRTNFSLSHVKLSGYTTFDIYHSDLYAQFLYYLSNSVWKNSKDKILASKLFYLNKALHGINCMFDTELPEIFILIHCVGTVLGKANYSNYFVACQNVTVGTDKGKSPVISEGVYMGPRSSAIGNCQIMKFTHFGVNSILLNEDSMGNCVIIGSSPNVNQKKLKRNLILEYYFK